MRHLIALLVLPLASPALGGCDFLKDPLGLYAPETPRVVAPLTLTGRVVDAADIFDAQTEARLTGELAALENDLGPQLVVVSTPDLKGQTIADYSLALGRGWGIGDKTRNDGVLLVVAPTERKVRIEVGYGLESTLSDPLCAEIIQQTILPSYRAGDIAGGTVGGIERLDRELRARLGKRVA